LTQLRGRFGNASRSIFRAQKKRCAIFTRISIAVHNTHEAILITDANANIIRVNQTFQDTTGYRAEEVIGKNPRILSSGRQDKAVYVDMWQQLQANGTWSGELWDRHKDGHIYPKNLIITAVKNALGETTEYVSIFSDCQQFKQRVLWKKSPEFCSCIRQTPRD